MLSRIFQRQNRLPGRSGFTLIELLVVVTIIAILSAVGLSVFTNAQKRARDSRRRADLRQIQNAMESNYGTTVANQYPVIQGAWFETGVIPLDPVNSGSYTYVRTGAALDTAGAVYTVTATFETAGAGTFVVKNLQ